MPQSALPPQLTRLTALLDEQAGRYRELNGARHVGEYLSRTRPREDEELLTEPILAAIIERSSPSRRIRTSRSSGAAA